MPREVIPREEGRRLFGADPEAYDRARPGHPERVYEVLVERCGLAPDVPVLEIGAGTGHATRRLLDLGANPLAVIEPNPELAEHLARVLGDRVDLYRVVLERAELPGASFDLAAAASSFHWIDRDLGLQIVRRALRPGGWIALWWTGFGDRARPDPFRDATEALLEAMPRSPAGSHPGGRTPTEGGGEVWVAALEAAGYEDVSYERIPWTVTLDAARIRAIFATFSPFLVVDEQTRTETLDELERIARVEFGDRVEKPLATSLYTARKPS